MQPDVALNAAHWMYLFSVAAIILTMILRANVVVPSVIGTFLVVLAITGSPVSALIGIFSASFVAAKELFNIFLVITFMTALLNALKTLQGQLDETLLSDRLIALLAAGFGLLATLLASVGLYGVMAFVVARRRKELGIRLALGAQPSGIVHLVCRRIGVLIVAGLALGLAASLWAAQFLKALLFDVEAHDPATFTAAASVLVAVGLLAAWIPARRAARLNPAAVLREG